MIQLALARIREFRVSQTAGRFALGNQYITPYDPLKQFILSSFIFERDSLNMPWHCIGGRRNLKLRLYSSNQEERWRTQLVAEPS